MRWSWLCILLVLVLVILIEVEGSCRDPEVPKNGWRSSPDKHVFQPGEIVHYYCKTNYTLKGSVKVKCLPSGYWHSKVPVCIDPCGTCDHGGTCLHQSGTRFACVCTAGFRGDKCDIPHCTKPRDVKNGGFDVSPPRSGGGLEYDVGSTLMFSCHLGYIIWGSNYDIRCILRNDDKAMWSRLFPTCIPRTCQNQLSGRLTLANGNYVPRKTRYSIGDIVHFSCNGGFALHGSEFVSCHRTGLWSSVTWPRCIAKSCVVPPGISNGHVIQEGRNFPAGTKITFECSRGKGYYRFGPKTQTCESDSNGKMLWKPKRPVCVTRLQFEQYCQLEGKMMTLYPEPSCVQRSPNGGQTTTSKRNASIDTLTIVTGTAGGLLGFLLVIIAFVICQRRRLVRRMRLAASRRNRTAEDQRMLIYCSNDFHFFLPSYDEAMRSRPAEPPPFDAVVNEADGATQNDAAGAASVSNEETEGANAASQEISENEYETIDNVSSQATAPVRPTAPRRHGGWISEVLQRDAQSSAETTNDQSSETGNLRSESPENHYETVDNDLHRPTSSSSASPVEPIYSVVQRNRPDSNNDIEIAIEEEESQPCSPVAGSDVTTVAARSGSISSQESTTDENRPLI